MGMLGSEFAAGTGLATARDSSTRRTLPIHYLNATKLAALIRTKESSSREAVRAHPGRINAVDPRVNAIVALTADDAPKVADAADKAVAGGETLGLVTGRTNNTDRMKKSRRTKGRGQIADPDWELLCLLSSALYPLQLSLQLRIIRGAWSAPPAGRAVGSLRRSRPACRRSASAATWRSRCVAPPRSPASPR